MALGWARLGDIELWGGDGHLGGRSYKPELGQVGMGWVQGVDPSD